ncbi:MAG TPA: hypothetical protein VE030_09755, partial [Burkholderiales bacterium]|nr:hypothetical protein [Burkholderiales bacterium]
LCDSKLAGFLRSTRLKMRPERAKRYNGAFFATNDLMQAFMTSTTLVAIAGIGDNTLRSSLLRRRLMLAQPA